MGYEVDSLKNDGSIVILNNTTGIATPVYNMTMVITCIGGTDLGKYFTETEIDTLIDAFDVSEGDEEK